MIGVLRKLRREIWRQGIRLVLVVIVLAVFGIADRVAETGQPATGGQTAAKSAEQPDPQRLVGRWARPDGGYVLELRDVKNEGSVQASYFNPRPINVSRAEVGRTDGALTVFVELRDVNYPGSAYNLRYDPASDRLKGTYFQAVERQTYDIEFLRIK